MTKKNTHAVKFKPVPVDISISLLVRKDGDGHTTDLETPTDHCSGFIKFTCQISFKRWRKKYGAYCTAPY